MNGQPPPTESSGSASHHGSVTPGEIASTETGTESFNFHLATIPCYAFMTCDNVHSSVSAFIVALACAAFLENLLLVLAMSAWNMRKTCKMFWFLWHLAIADAILAATFIYFHARILFSCPLPFSCQPSYAQESQVLLVGFFGTIIASHLFVLAAAFDRFIAVKWPLQYAELMSTKVARGTAVAVWTFSFSVPVAGVVAIRVADSAATYSAVVLMTSSTCLACALCVVSMNAWMVSSAWASMKSGHPPRTRRSGSNLSAASESFGDRMKLAVTLALFVCSFVLSCAPWSVALFLCEEIKKCSIKRDEDYTLVMVLFHAVAIPVLYGFRVEAVNACVVDFSKKFLIKLTCRNIRDCLSERCGL